MEVSRESSIRIGTGHTLRGCVRCRGIRIGCALIAGIASACHGLGAGLPLGTAGTVHVRGTIERATAHGDAPVVVVLEAARPRRDWFGALRRPGEVALEIQGGVLVPAVPVLAPGQRVRFRNGDPVHHELFGLVEAGRLGLHVPAAGVSGPTVIPAAEGPVSLFCELHPGESHLLVVSRAERHALVDAQDRFEFDDVPPGTYQLVAIGAHGATPVRELSLAPGPDVAVSLRMTAP